MACHKQRIHSRRTTCETDPSNCGLIPAITGHDIWGCQLSGLERLGHALAGISSLAGPLGHLNDLIGGPATEAIGDVSQACGGCFVAGTPLQMADGTSQPIEAAQAGQQVQSRDEKTVASFPQTKGAAAFASLTQS